MSVHEENSVLDYYHISEKKCLDFLSLQNHVLSLVRVLNSDNNLERDSKLKVNFLGFEKALLKI